jgi:sugar phosphate isomerase/epimerase
MTRPREARFRTLLCNEVIRDLPFEDQCSLAAELGFDGLELAPFTLAEHPDRLPEERRHEIRRAAAEAGLEIGGLHWLLASPAGLSITDPAPDVRERTLKLMNALPRLCADLGGRVLVHGSPVQRRLAGLEEEAARGRAREAFEIAAEAAEAAGVVYCVEPLAPPEADYLTTVEETAALVRSIGAPSLRTMIDAKAARGAEAEELPALLERWLPSGLIAHVHLNDRTRRAPGQGPDRFLEALEVLVRLGYDGYVSVEPFEYVPDGPTAASWSAGYLTGLAEALGLRA